MLFGFYNVSTYYISTHSHNLKEIEREFSLLGKMGNVKTALSICFAAAGMEAAPSPAERVPHPSFLLGNYTQQLSFRLPEL